MNYDYKPSGWSFRSGNTYVRFGHICSVIVALVAAMTSISAGNPKVPFFLQFTDKVASTAGIGLLRKTPIPELSSEIRIWIGFGVVIPAHMLRLQVGREGEVKGEVLVHFPSDLSYMGEDASEFRRDVMRGCTDLRRGKKIDVCTAVFRSTPDWSTLHRRLTTLGIATLPDESELPKQEIVVFDGIAMVVEVRDGSSYRAYEYANPSLRSGPHAEAASQIIQAIGNVIYLSGDN